MSTPSRTFEWIVEHLSGNGRCVQCGGPVNIWFRILGHADEHAHPRVCIGVLQAENTRLRAQLLKVEGHLP